MEADQKIVNDTEALLCKSTGKPVEQFATGSIRDNQTGKGRYDLITPEGMRRVALRYEAGALKYSERNWEKGQPITRILGSALRHTFQYLAGQRDEDHLGAAAWNLLAAIHIEREVIEGRLPAELANMTKPRDQGEHEKYLKSLGYDTKTNSLSGGTNID